MQLPLDQIALFGYSLLFVFSVYKLSDTFKRPLDLFSNVLLLVGLLSLMVYHYRKIRTGKDEKTDASQKQVRLVAHTSITAFFLMTLAPFTKSVFRLYDIFGMTAHAYLILAVARNITQIFGVGALAAYFAFASFQSAKRFSFNSVELLNAVGRFALLIFFTVSFFQGLSSAM